MASTTDSESAQALFCALADFVSAKNVNYIFNFGKYLEGFLLFSE